MADKINQVNTSIGRIKPREITEEMRESYIDYAMSVIVSRALPDVRDGLKPVHRRILYAMWEDGLTHGAKFRKSASVIGATLSRYHPHGDMAVYDALVRMAQDFSLRYPLITPQGNFGCFTKDTKIRLTDGRSLSFGELVGEYTMGKKHWTFSFNPKSQKVEIAEIKNPRLTRRKAELVEVELDNGERIKCTLDHKFMLRDGSYREAQKLKSGDSLMPLPEEVFSNKKPAFWADSSETANNSIVSARQPNLSIAEQEILSSPACGTKAVDGTGVAPVGFWLTSRNRNTADLVYQNHKVVGTKILNKREDVYDLTVEPWHNFSLDAGVFVHNSIDGDSAAAYRYTECKLSKIGEAMLQDIEKETVDWVDNYDGTRKEPTVLPSPLPQLLLNGSLGIAVGMATNIPPHNLAEVVDALLYLIDNPKADTEDLFKFIKGPDFPTAGIIFDQKEIMAAYAQGKGPIVTRGKAEVIESEKGKNQIIITEIPYQVQKSSLIEQFANLAQEKKIEGVKDIRDESDKEGMRIVLDLSKEAYPQKVLNRLYKFSDLQRTFHLNMLALVEGLQPRVLNLPESLTFFIGHRKEVVYRRTKYDLDKAKERAHILEGLQVALSKIDAVISTIKKSKDREDAKQNLLKKFKLTEIQANAILEIKLQQLARLERQKIEEELKEILAKIKELTAILKSPQKIKEVVKKELGALKEAFGDERRTKIVVQKIGEIAEEDLVPREETIITLTQGGYIKRINPKTYRIQKRGGKGIMGMKTLQDDIVEHFLSAETHDSLFFFTDSGKIFKCPVYEIPEGTRVARGRGLLNFLEISPQDKVLSLFPLGKEDKDSGVKYLVMATKQGIVKKTALPAFDNVRRSGLIAITLKKGDLLRKVQKSSGQDEIILVTKKGQAVRFRESAIREMGRQASGIKGMRLKSGDEVVGMEVIKTQNLNLKSQNYLLVVMENGYGKRTEIGEYRLQGRGGSGIKTANITPKTGQIVFSQLLTAEEEDLIVISCKGQVVRTAISSIPKLSRATQGVRIMRLEPGDKVASAACI